MPVVVVDRAVEIHLAPFLKGWSVPHVAHTCTHDCSGPLDIIEGHTPYSIRICGRIAPKLRDTSETTGGKLCSRCNTVEDTGMRRIVMRDGGKDQGE